MAIAAGLIAVLLGLWGMFHWAGEFLIIIKGLIPVSLVFAGIVALIVGLSAKSSSPSDKQGHEKS